MIKLINIRLLQRWFFSTAIAPINRWQFSPTDGVAAHLKNCPYNVIEPLQPMPKTKAFDQILADVRNKQKAKADYYKLLDDKKKELAHKSQIA